LKVEFAVLFSCILLFSVFEIPIGHAISEPVLPDLVVTDFWQEGAYVYYQVMNIGNNSAVGNHVDALFINGDKTAWNNIDKSLDPGERYNGTFPFSAGEVTVDPFSVKVQTDVNNSIMESDETNNSLEKVWKADSTPPTFYSEPSVDGVTQTSGVVSWVTDEISDSLVQYGKDSGVYDLMAKTSDLVTAHSVPLTGLEPCTTYHFTVQSSDASGNTAQSRELTFQTLPTPDSASPIVSLLDLPGTLQGLVNVQAEASDNAGLEKVEFYLDGNLVFTDFSPPYRLRLDTSNYENGAYQLTATAYDLSGNPSSSERAIDIVNVRDETAPTVMITSPLADATVSGKVKVTASLTDDTGLAQVYMKIDGQFEAFQGFPDYPKTQTASFDWDTTLVPNGKHRIALEVYDKEVKYGVATCDVNVYQPPTLLPPKLKITSHSVTRHDNYFTIALTVENIGDLAATNVVVEDCLSSFQPIIRSDAYADYAVDYVPSTGYGFCIITSKLPILAKQSVTYAYEAVPVLTSLMPPTAPLIGAVNLGYESEEGAEFSDFFNVPIPITANGETVLAAYSNALKAADYLIVTNPQMLFWLNGHGDVDTLLSTMAQLARYKQGALGYFTWAGAYAEQVLRNLIQEGGSWSSKLQNGWTSNGYFLIVGETEIIPTWTRYVGTWETSVGDYTWNVLTDYPYASTYGEEEIPELCIGRIIGNDAKILTSVIKHSLNVYLDLPGYVFERSTALLASGFPGPPNNSMDFKGIVDAVSKILSQKTPDCIQYKLNTPDYAVYDDSGQVNTDITDPAIQAAFFKVVGYKDVIFLAAHGGNGWDKIFTPVVMSKSNIFGTSCPFVFVSACDQGMYSGVLGFAEAILQKGAAVCLAATESGGWKAQATKFFEMWDVNEPVSLAVKQTKISLGDGYQDKVWKAVYHVYGDAKFGSLPSAATYSAANEYSVATSQPLSSIDVIVPDYTVTKAEGKDYVEIPDGLQLCLPGQPQIPYYRVLNEYPKDCMIQDVLLRQRSDPVKTTGLNIPNCVLTLPANGASILQLSDGSESLPDEGFEWKVYEGPDSTTLAITLYPFRYNPLTTDAEFYKEYSFDVNYVVSSVRITALGTSKRVYDLGEDVSFDLGLENTGPDGKSVVVNAFIKEEGSDEITGGFPLRTLENLMGQASYSSTWSTAGIEPGDYSVTVELRGTQGVLLDRRIEGFRIATDETPPDTVLTTGEPEYGTNGITYLPSATPIILSAQDNSGGSGVSSTAYRVRSDLHTSEWAMYPGPFHLTDLTDGVYFIDYNSTDFSGNHEPTKTAKVFLDNTAPSQTIETPITDAALQDGVIFTVSASDLSAVASIKFSIQCAQGNTISAEFQQMPATLEIDGKWHLYFDTRRLPDGSYLFVANGTDILGNWGLETVPFSTRNWATIELLPATPRNRAGRTMPIKFSIRVKAGVDPAQPFIYNEELTIKIYKKASPSNILLQTSTFGSGSTNYRIDTGTLYITNFKTLSTPATYVVEIWRKGEVIHSFQFSTVK
jgi:hypothetical protein